MRHIETKFVFSQMCDRIKLEHSREYIWDAHAHAEANAMLN